MSKELELQEAQEASTQDVLISDLRKQNLELQTQIKSLEIRGLEVYKENSNLKASPETASKMSQLEYDLRIADMFVKSGSLPVKNAFQAYIIMKAGEEMGLAHMESIQSLYIVNGQVSAWGKGMVSVLTKNGYDIEFLDESTKGVTVVISKGGFQKVYIVDRDKEDSFEKSKAMTFAPKNKMRFHGIRQIIKFHLAHLFGSVSLEDADDFESANKELGTYDPVLKIGESEENEILKNIDNCEDKEQLLMYYNALDKAERTSNVMKKFTEVKIKFIKQSQSNG